jgi:hypothetical protein
MGARIFALRELLGSVHRTDVITLSRIVRPTAGPRAGEHVRTTPARRAPDAVKASIRFLRIVGPSATPGSSPVGALEEIWIRRGLSEVQARAIIRAALARRFV